MSQPVFTLIEGPPLAHPLPGLTLPQWIRARARARHRPDAAALIDGISGSRYSYGALDHLVGRCAAGLAALGFARGDVLLMLAPNSPEWPIAALGAMAAGGAVSGADPGYGAADLAQQWCQTGARFVFTTPALLATVREAAATAAAAGVAGVAGPLHILLLGDADGAVAFASLLACADAEPVWACASGDAGAADAALDATAALPFSSGATGLPNAVLLTHRRLLAHLCQLEQANPLRAGSVVLALLPMFHVFSFISVTLAGLARGCSVVTLPRFEPALFLQTLASHRVTWLATVPPILRFLARHRLVDAHDLSSLERITCSAAHAAPALQAQVAARLHCAVETQG